MTTTPARPGRRPSPAVGGPSAHLPPAQTVTPPTGDLTDKVFAFSNEVIYITIGGVLWLVCSLPIFTIGAASAGLHALMLGHRVGGRRAYARPFFTAFKASFKQVTLPWLLLLALMLVFGFNSWFYLFSHRPVTTMDLILGVIQVVLLAVALVVATYMAALVAIDVDDGIGGDVPPRTRSLIVQAALTALGTWWWALAVLIVTLGVPAVFWRLGVWEFSVFTVGLIVWLDDWILAKALRDDA